MPIEIFQRREHPTLNTFYPIPEDKAEMMRRGGRKKKKKAIKNERPITDVGKVIIIKYWPQLSIIGRFCVCTCVSVYLRVYVCTYVCKCLCVHVYVCTRVLVYVCMCACVYVFMCGCV